VRLDLYLKLSRLVKRRSVAHELCENGRVLLNGKAAKPSKDIKPGDVLTLQFSTKSIELEVLIAPTSSGKSLPGEPYRVIAERRGTGITNE
jgi:ribosomal 50S subunit-recycling heat shock protein